MSDPDGLASKSNRELILVAIAKLRAQGETQKYLVSLVEALGGQRQTPRITSLVILESNGVYVMSGTTGTGSNVGTYSALVGQQCVFTAVATNDDGTPPTVTLTPPTGGSVAISAENGVAHSYTVTISGLTAGTTLVEVAGDGVGDCFLTLNVSAPPVETFAVDPSSVTISTPAA